MIFTPHLGNFKRGILETITCRLKPGVGHAQIAAVTSRLTPINHWYVYMIKACPL